MALFGKWALTAIALAGFGVLISIAGEQTGRPFLREVVGPAVTLVGAGVWLAARLRRR